MIGSGGHARVLQEAVFEAGFELSGFVAPSPEGSLLADEVEWIGTDETALNLDPDEVIFINGVGSAGSTKVRNAIFENYKLHGHNFLQVTSIQSIVSPTAVLVEGVQVLPGAIVNTEAVVYDNSIINTGAIVEHHARIGAGCHIAPGVVICGSAEIGAGTHVGAGATVIQGVKIGTKCIIGAGAVVVSDIPDGHTAVGVPAKARPNK